MSRRELMKLGLAAGAIALSARMGNAAGEQAGGVCNIRLSADPSSFDSIGNTASNVVTVLSPCYSALVMHDQENPGQIIGDLARDWTISDDGRQYTFRLYPEVRFHDGMPLTSADVKFTFDRIRQPPEGVTSSRKNLFGRVTDIDTPDPQTVVFTLERPAAVFLDLLASAWMMVLPKHVFDAGGDLSDSIIGSGPFRFVEYNRGVSIKLERNPDYHIAGRPWLEGLNYFVVPDDGTSMANLVNGQLDVYSEFSGDQLQSATKAYGDRIRILRATSLSGDGISLNSRRAPFDNPRLREAFSLALDREAAIRVAQRGLGTVGGFMPPGPWSLPPERLADISGYGGEIEDRRARARKLFAEAGQTTLAVTMTARKGVSTHEARAIFVKDQLAQVGVAVTVDLRESADYFERINTNDFQIATTQLGGLANDPDLLFGEYHTSFGSTNYSGVSDPDIDRLFTEQSAEQDASRRKQLVDEMNMRAIGQFGFILLFWKEDFFAHSARLRNVFLHQQADNNRRMADVWISPAS